MGSLITLSTNEVAKATADFSADAIVNYSPRALKTLDDCKEQYTKATEIAEVAKNAIRDGLQGSAVLQAKRLICEKEWNVPRMTKFYAKKWSDFLVSIKCSHQQAGYLLDFAGYKEVEAQLIEDGEKVTPIETASHFREVKKNSNYKEHIDVAYEYDDAVEANNGVIPKTAKEVEEVVQKAKNKVSSLELFYKEHPEHEMGEEPKSSMSFSENVSKLIPNVDRDEWKSFYKQVAKCVHPDKGGTATDMMILTAFKELMTSYHIQSYLLDCKKNKEVAYKIWCENYGCSPYDWVEEIKG